MAIPGIRIVEIAGDTILAEYDLPGGVRLEFLATLRIDGDIAYLDRLHVGGGSKNIVSAALLWVAGSIAAEIMERLDVSSVIISPNQRASGANPGHWTREIAFGAERERRRDPRV